MAYVRGRAKRLPTASTHCKALRLIDAWHKSKAVVVLKGFTDDSSSRGTHPNINALGADER